MNVEMCEMCRPDTHALAPVYPWPRPGFAGPMFTAPIRILYSDENMFYTSRASRSRPGLGTGRAGL